MTAPDAGRRPRGGLVLALLGLAQLITSIDYNIVYVALPRIGADLGFSDQNLQWVVSAYAVAFGGFLLLGGRAADLLGRRRIFVAGLALYAVASLAGGLAGVAGLLVAARAVQGLGGALLFPATLALVVTSFDEGRDRNRAFSVWAAAGAGGMVLGSLLGGVLTEAFGWSAVFYVNVPLAALAIAGARLLLPPDGPRAPGRFDLLGAVTATGGVTLVVFSLVQGPVLGWTSPALLAAAAGGVALLAVFITVEARTASPLMPLRLFRNRNLSTGVSLTLLFMATFGTLLYFLTVHFQRVLGYSALQTGLAYVVPMAAGAAGSLAGGRLAYRFGNRPTLVVSLTVGAAATVALGLGIGAGGSYLALLPSMVVLNVAQGVVFTTMFAAATTGTALFDQGIASGIVSTGQQVGSAVGLAALVAVANAGTEGLTGPQLRTATSSGLRDAVLVAAAGMVLTILVATNFRRPPATAAPEPDIAAESATR
ncbi:MFS transporter [Dactylosporangium sp. NPDC051485]|uniref:MFS transporter n=1 Tax=Dactylosporangium sp. NPDC051485 TaxID=3154846 RepID=UPI00342F1C79